MDLNNSDVEKFVSLARNAAKAPRKTETHYDGETLSGLLSNKKPTEDELADLVVAALGSENLITNHSDTLH